jgi:hypothetical protein
MSIFSKATAPATQLADRAETGHLGIELPIEGAQIILKPSCRARVVGRERSVGLVHLRTMDNEERISVKV